LSDEVLGKIDKVLGDVVNRDPSATENSSPKERLI
jgi:hypothetical protein